jgi:PPM family protein phosphatase
VTVALRIVEIAGLTDVGRQRNSNEDNFVIAEPLFAVADGMGGAKAGEVASKIAAETLEADSEETAPEKRLTKIAEDANTKIYELARSDDSRRGMGTTFTAAMVGEREVSIGHVGDSRAYLLRGDKFEQLTDDHSLVAELERSGQIAPGAAEHHPQKSIITRALGPEPVVEVDTHTHVGKAGDLYLLCSDGLTGMISDDEIAAILRGSDSLEEAATELIRAANQSGGRDNITVVLFRLGDADGAEETEEVPADDKTIAGDLTADDLKAAVEEQETAGRVATEAAPRQKAAAPAPRSRTRRSLRALVALIVVAAVGAGLYAGSRQIYFVGTNDAGLVTLYRGLPYELPFGLELYSEEYASGVPARSIAAGRRDRVLDHEWRGRSDAVDLVRQLERGTLEGAG